MRPIAAIAVATWMLDHLAPQPYRGALSGDLLEELHGGRSLPWFWRQVLSAVAIGLLTNLRRYGVPLAFSAGWSMLFPVWQISVWRSPFSQAVFSRWSTLGWPYSLSLDVGREFLPAATFVWLGLMVYLLLLRPTSHLRSGLRILASLSLSLNVLLIVSIALSFWSRSTSASHLLGNDTLFLSPYRLVLSFPLASSLFAALAVASPRNPHTSGHNLSLS